MSSDLGILAATAVSIGLIHTVIGPDHYLPFLAMSGSRRWTLRRTLAITAVCGVGHVLGSLALGAAGIALGWAVIGLERFEVWRGEVAAWLLLGFGLAYTLWGVRQATRNRPHSHWHGHSDGTIHDHEHRHAGAHAHPHATAGKAGITPWVLFTIFVFGPCEPLIPVLMYPAAQGSWWGVALVAGLFGLATLATMLVMVTLGYLGLSRLSLGRLERYSHALAGLALVVCGLAIQFGL